MIDAAVISKAGILASLAGISTMFAQVDFKGTITLGSILIAILIAAIAGFATIRSRVSSIWREEANGWREKAERQEAELVAKQAEMSAFAHDQQEVRHQLKGELAAMSARLKVEEAKHDLGLLLERMQDLHNQAMTAMGSQTVAAVGDISRAINDLGVRIDEGRREQRDLLTEIRDSLKGGQK